MCYHGFEYKYPEDKQDGDGFKTGDIVTMEVDRFVQEVKYSVNMPNLYNVLRMSRKNKMRADSNRVFVPFVEIHETEDTVELLAMNE